MTIGRCRVGFSPEWFMKKKFFLNASSICEIFQHIKKEMHSFNLKNSSKIEIAIDEVVSNIINYSKSPYLEIECSQSKDGSLSVKIKDQGIPFNPILFSQIPMEQRISEGYGIYLIFKLAREVDYRYEKKCNILTLNFLYD